MKMKRFYFKINNGEPVEIGCDPHNKETLTLEIVEGVFEFIDKEGNICLLYTEVDE